MKQSKKVKAQLAESEYHALFLRCAVMKDREKKMYWHLLKWLDYDGIAFFKMLNQEYGSIIKAAWIEHGIPHHVHFREGMVVRNFLRR